MAGLGAVVLANVAARFSNAGPGVPSPFEAPVDEIAAYYADYAAFTATSSWLYGLAVICFVVFAAGVWDRLRASGSTEARTWATVGVVGAAVYAVLLILVGLLQLGLVGLAQRAGSSVESLAGLTIIWAVAAAALVPGSVPMLLGFGMAARRSGEFSGLLCGLALTGAALGLVPPPEMVGPASVVAANIAFILSQLQPWMLVAWTLGTAFVLQRPRAAEQEPGTRPEVEGG